MATDGDTAYLTDRGRFRAAAEWHRARSRDCSGCGLIAGPPQYFAKHGQADPPLCHECVKGAGLELSRGS